MGRCVGDAAPETPPSEGEPYTIGSSTIDRQALQAWNLIGYRENPAGQLVGPDGQPASAAFVQWMYQPEDFSRVRVAASVWSNLLSMGFRLDEQSCTLKSAQGTLPRFYFRALQENWRRNLEKMALEQLRAHLTGLDPEGPIPSEIIEQSKLLANAGTPLPRDIERLLRAPGAQIGALTQSIDAAYADAARFFDGQLTWADLAKGALPPVLGLTARRPLPIPMAPDEQRLDALFAAEVEAKFSRTPEGRELLARFRKQDGKVVFPPLLFLKATQRSDDPGMPGAFFSPANGIVATNHWTAEAIVLESLPPAQRARRAQEFTDQQTFQRYLLDHPQARTALLAYFDSGFFHELIHARQSPSYTIELMRGNLPNASPLINEHEAFREQCGYELGLVLRDPAIIENRGHFGYYCLPLLKGYRGFSEKIDDSYKGKFAGSSDLSDVAAIQKQRRSAALRLMKEGLRQKALQMLKLAGMSQGDKALREFEVDSSRRERKFIQERLPELRARALRELPSKYLEMGRPDLALSILDNLPEETPGLSEARQSWIFDAEPAMLRPGPRFPLPSRMSAWGALFNGLEKSLKQMPVQDAVYQRLADMNRRLYGAYQRDLRAYVPFLLREADSAKDPKIRTDILKNAAEWSTQLPKDDPLRKTLAPESLQ